MAGAVTGVCIGLAMIFITKAMPLIMQGSVGLLLGYAAASLLWWLKSTDPG